MPDDIAKRGGRAGREQDEAAAQAEAARMAPAKAGANCEIVENRELLLDEFEHTLRCDR